MAELAEFEEALFVSGRVRVVLVGWWPASGVREERWRSYLTVQREYRPGETDDASTANAASGEDSEPLGWTPPIGLVSVHHSRVLRWDGRSALPGRATERLREARALADSLGVALRVHQAPAIARVYAWLLDNGVDLIGLKRFVEDSRFLPETARR